MPFETAEDLLLANGGVPDAARSDLVRGLSRINPSAGGPAISRREPTGRAFDNRRVSDGDGADQAASERADEHDNGGLRLRDFVRALMTVRSSGTERLLDLGQNGAVPQRTFFAGAGDSGSLVEAILDVSLDADLLEVLTKIVTPAIEPGQFVSFSIAGLGRFVLLFSGDDRSLRLMDLDGSMSMLISPPHQGGGVLRDRYIDGPAVAVAPQPGDGISIKDALAFLRNEIWSFLTNPLTIIAAVVSGLLWLLWRLRGRVA